MPPAAIASSVFSGIRGTPRRMQELERAAPAGNFGPGPHPPHSQSNAVGEALDRLRHQLLVDGLRRPARTRRACRRWSVSDSPDCIELLAVVAPRLRDRLEDVREAPQPVPRLRRQVRRRPERLSLRRQEAGSAASRRCG